MSTCPDQPSLNDTRPTNALNPDDEEEEEEAVEMPETDKMDEEDHSTREEDVPEEEGDVDMEDGEGEEEEDLKDDSSNEEKKVVVNDHDQEVASELASGTETKDGHHENESPDEGKSDTAHRTRGRAADHTSTDLLDSLARESELSLARERDHAPASIGASFLSESLTEEERRTRTRYLPDVEGFHALRKLEVKADLALARSIVSSSGVAATLNKKKRSREDDMEIEAEEAAPSEDDRSSDAPRATAKVIEIGRNEYVVPTTAFVAPPAIPSASNGENSARAGKVVPTEVDSVTAFNPPRPPESVGPKKKHRMMRWEQNPASIEIDLANYRKTVKKTRQELKNAQNERDRIIAVDNHLRRNFFSHLQCLNDELLQLSQEFAEVQQECVKSADLLTSRTRSRGTGKGAYVMRDVLTVLRTRGAEMQEKGVTFEMADIAAPESYPGVGGVGALSFEDWDKSTKIEPKPPASGWILAGDKVSSPYGTGTVEKMLFPDGSMYAVGSSSQNGSIMENASKERRGAKEAFTTPQVVVQLSYGIGYFPLASVVSIENPSKYSDARLALRWKGIMESAPTFGSCPDLEAMQGFTPWDQTEPENSDDVDYDGKSDAADDKKTRLRTVPFASDVIPTCAGRGGDLHKTDLYTLDEKLHKGLFEGIGVLGMRDNNGVPESVRALEDRKERYIRAKARSLQLTNALLRQRRITKMNSKTLSSSQEKSSRVQALVTEMRSDLGSLKSRLDEELRALGISEKEAQEILAEHYG